MTTQFKINDASHFLPSVENCPEQLSRIRNKPQEIFSNSMNFRFRDAPCLTMKHPIHYSLLAGGKRMTLFIVWILFNALVAVALTPVVQA